MNVNFTGIKNIRVLSVTNPNKPHFPEFQQANDKDICVIRLECQLTENDFDSFKSVTDNSDVFKCSESPFVEGETLNIDIAAKNEKKQYDVYLNRKKVPQDEYAIFGIVTYLCALTKAVKEGNSDNLKLHKFLDMMNLACDRVGKRALKKVF